MFFIFSAVFTFLLLLLHRLLDVLKPLGHHRSKLLHHTLAEVEEGLQNVLQSHPLQEAGVAGRVVGVRGVLLHQGVGVVQEGFLQDLVQPAAHPGDQLHAAVHQPPDPAAQAAEGLLDAVRLHVAVLGALVHQDVPCIQTGLFGAEAPRHSAEEVLHLQSEKRWR